MTFKSIKSLSHLVSRAHCYEISSTDELFSGSEQLATEYLCSCYLIDVKRFSKFCQWKWKSVVLIEAKNVSSIGSTAVEKQSEVDEKGGCLIGCPLSFCMLIEGKNPGVLFNKLVLVFIHTSKLHPNYNHFIHDNDYHIDELVSFNQLLFNQHALSPLSKITINIGLFP